MQTCPVRFRVSKQVRSWIGLCAFVAALVFAGTWLLGYGERIYARNVLYGAVMNVKHAVEIFEKKYNRRPSNLQELIDTEIMNEWDVYVPNGENDIIPINESFDDGDDALLETGEVRVFGGRSFRLMSDLTIVELDGDGHVINRK